MMSRNLIGTLTDPSGTALAGWTLVLTATSSQSPTLPSGARETVILDASGGYNLTLLDGAYNVVLISPTNGALTPLGAITVTTGAPVDVLALLGIAAVLPSAAETVVDAAVAAHAAAADPHGGYQKESEKGVASGYASLDAGGTVPDAQIPAAIARDTELAAEAALARNADNLTSGTVADALIAATIARNSQVPALAWASGPPTKTFAELPAASAAPWAIYRLSDARNTLWESNGTIWRPHGGRQVLAQRSINPVTVQNLSGEVAETIGPFPGGLVRAGMALEMDVRVGHSGIGTGNRMALGSINGALWWHAQAAVSGAALELRRNVPLDVISDTNATMRRLTSIQNSFTVGNIPSTIVANFSADWSTNIFLQSAAETAVAISTATWAANVATYNTSAAHTLAVGDKTVIAGVTPSGYNVAAGAIVLSVPTTTSFTVAIASDPGAYTSGGTSSRISNMVSQSYVLEVVG